MTETSDYLYKLNLRETTEQIQRSGDSQFIQTELYKSMENCIVKYDKIKHEFMDKFKELMKKVDINFTPRDGSFPSLLMIACGKGDPQIIRLILEQPHLKDKKKVDLLKIDKSKRNVIHYILKKNTYEKGALENIDILFEYIKKNYQDESIIKELLQQKDIDDDTPLTLILSNGWSQVLDRYFKYVEYKRYTRPIDGFNLIHCAVKGKSFLCLQKILSMSESEEYNSMNKEGNTPAQFAAKKNYFFFEKYIIKNKKNFNILHCKQDVHIEQFFTNNIINSFNSKEYAKCLSQLSLYKMNKKLIGKYTDPTLKWNKMLTAHYDNIVKDQNRGMMLIEHISKFYKKYIKENAIKEHNSQNDILIYNKVLFLLKIGDLRNCIKTIELYFTHIKGQNTNKHYIRILHVNFSFILIECFISINQNALASFLAEKIEKYLTDNYKRIQNESDEAQSIKSYLDKTEVLNLYSPTWDETFCLLKLMRSIICLDSNTEESKIILKKKYKKDVKNCSYAIAKDYPIFNRMNSMYNIIKTKIYYQMSDQGTIHIKSLHKLNRIKEVFYNMSIEHKLFYYNSLGILNLKLEKYSIAEYLFKMGLEISKEQMKGNLKGKKEDDIQVQRFNFIYYLKYNLALSLFYQKKFKESNVILKELSQKPLMNKNVYLWYRLGITSLEIHFKNSKPKNINSEIISKTIGYTNKKKCDLENGRNVGLDYSEKESKDDNDNNLDELYTAFENKCKMKKDNTFISNISNQKESKHPKRILLHYPQPIVKSDYLSEAINSFRKVILISKRRSLIDRKEKQWITSILQSYNSPSTGNNTKTVRESPPFNISINLNILLSSYLNLLFSLSIKGNWLEILYLYNSIQRENFQRTNEVEAKLLYFKIEALISIGRIDQAEDTIKELLNKSQQENFKWNFYNKLNTNLVIDIPFKLGVSIGSILAMCKMRKFVDAEEKLIHLIEEYYKGKESEIPNYIFNLGIFIFLSQGKKGINKAIKLIKQKTFDIRNDIS